MHDLAHSFADLVEKGDIVALNGLLSDDIEVWHNTDNAVVNRDACIAALNMLVRLSIHRAYRNRQVSVLPAGFVFQFLLEAQADSGALSVPGCMVCTVADGKILRIEEYIDPAPLRAWFAAASIAA